MKRPVTKLLLVGLVLLCGCQTLTSERLAKFLLPVNMAAAYFGTVALHESGHCLSARSLGGYDVSMRVLPHTHDGDFYFGRTSSRGVDASDLTIRHTMGPTATFAQSVMFRSALRSGSVPKILQPLFGWLDVFGRVASYYHTIVGLAGRPKKMDLSKEDRWIAGVFLIGNLVYDIGSWLLSDDDFDTYFGVLFGERFYGR